MKNLLIVTAVLSVFLISCEQEAEVPNEEEAISEVIAISENELPEASQDYIANNFAAEVIMSAYMIMDEHSNITYETFLSNQTNLVFDEAGTLTSFNADGENVTCDGRKKGRGRKGKKHGHHDDSTSLRNEIEVTELPELAQTYLSENYADSTILKVLEKIDEDETTVYKVLIENVGVIQFDSDGNFTELYVRSCYTFEEIEIDSLDESITTYISENYPDEVIAKARIGTLDDVTYTHVYLQDVGVLIFDESNVFIELKECRHGKDRDAEETEGE